MLGRMAIRKTDAELLLMKKKGIEASVRTVKVAVMLGRMGKRKIDARLLFFE